MNTFTPIVGDYVHLVSNVLTAELVGARGLFPSLNSELTDMIGQLRYANNSAVISPTYTPDFYINKTGGTKTAYTGLQYSAPIKLKYGEYIKLTTKGVSDQVSVLSKSYASGTFVSSIAQGSNQVQTYYYANTTKNSFEYIQVCGSMTQILVEKGLIAFDVNAADALSGSLKKTIGYSDISTTFTTGNYISPTGTKSADTNHQYSVPIQLKKGESIYLMGFGFSTNVSMLTKCKADGTFRSCIAVSNGAVTEYTYTAAEEIEYVQLCFDYLYRPFSYFKYDLTGKTKEDDLVFLKLLFENVICIGDNLTEGDYETGGTMDVRTRSYPYYLQKLTNWTVTNSGASGATATSYWDMVQTGIDYTITGPSGESHCRLIPTSFAAYGTAIILLGQNGGLTDTIDADTATPPYANTHTGNYCKLIEKIKADNPNCIVFLCAVPQNASAANVNTNVVIAKIAVKYNLPYLDLYNDSIMTADQGAIYRPLDNVHYGKLGYLTLAKTKLRLICKYVNKNLLPYKN